MMRLMLAAIILMMLAQPVWADTSNRAIQISPVAAIYVGGVGLLCASKKNENQLGTCLVQQD
tara:strand:- start:1161 stop:1346 length:186 start_codon:yes stop_codon:yes gene_type:complete